MEAKPYTTEDGDTLNGPDGWYAHLGEPEDRSWWRDGSDAVDRLNELHADLGAMRALIVGGTWRREEGRAYLCVRVADGADLSCPATRNDAINAALSPTQPQAHKAGGSDFVPTPEPDDEAGTWSDEEMRAFNRGLRNKPDDKEAPVSDVVVSERDKAAAKKANNQYWLDVDDEEVQARAITHYSAEAIATARAEGYGAGLEDAASKMFSLEALGEFDKGRIAKARDMLDMRRGLAKVIRNLAKDPA